MKEKESKSVYLIRHNGVPVYIGSTNNLARRRQQHLSGWTVHPYSFGDYYQKNPNRHEYSFQVLYTGPEWETQEEFFIKEYQKTSEALINKSTKARGNNAHCWRSCTGFTRAQVEKSVATRKRLAGTGALKRSKEFAERVSEINGQKVMCVETGEVFISFSKAADHFGTSHQTIMRAVNGSKTRLKHTFRKV